MYDIEEHTVFAWTVGLHLNPKRLEKLAVFIGKGDGNYTDCSEYRITNLEHCNKDLIKKFRITSAVLQKWHTVDDAFQICLFVREGELIGGRIYKRKTISGQQNLVSCLTAPTHQEIRITERILRYLSETDTDL